VRQHASTSFCRISVCEYTALTMPICVGGTDNRTQPGANESARCTQAARPECKASLARSLATGALKKWLVLRGQAHRRLVQDERLHAHATVCQHAAYVRLDGAGHLAHCAKSCKSMAREVQMAVRQDGDAPRRAAARTPGAR
jgi:hypothetical protein